MLGMIDCLNGREIIIKAQMATEEKKRSEQKEFDKLSAGKTTLKSIFSSKAKKETSMQNLDKNQEVLEKEISDYKALANYLTTYHAQQVIAKFKEEKYREYLRMLNNFCVKEISNAHTNATLYH